MGLIKVKNTENVEVTYEDIDSVVLRNVDGTAEVFRKVNYADALTSKSSGHCHNSFSISGLEIIVPETSVTVTVA